MTTLQNEIQDLYNNSKRITGSITSVETFLASNGDTAAINTFVVDLNTDMPGLPSLRAKTFAEVILLRAMAAQPFSTSLLSGLITDDQIQSINGSKITGVVFDEDIQGVEGSKVGGALTIATIPGSNVTGSINASQVSGDLDNASITGSNVTGSINASQVSGDLDNANLPGSNVTGNIDASQVSGDLENATIPGSNVTGSIDASQVNGALDSASLPGSNVTGNIDASQVSGDLENATIPGSNVTGSITEATIPVSSVTISDSDYDIPDYITDNRGFQIGTTNTAVALKVIDAKIGQIDTVFIKDNRGVMIGVDTDHNLHDASTMLQAIESKLGYSDKLPYPIFSVLDGSDYTALTTYPLIISSADDCSAPIVDIDVSSSKNPFDVMYGYFQCDMGEYPSDNLMTVNTALYFQQDGGTCMNLVDVAADISTVTGLCHKYLFSPLSIG